MSTFGDTAFVGPATSAVDGLSRRAFGVAAGIGLAGAVAACRGGQNRPAASAPAAPPPPSGPGVGCTLSHEQFTTPQLLDQAQAAEQAGFRYLWASDHLQPWQDNEGHAMNPWLTLALLTQKTSRITFGSHRRLDHRHRRTDPHQRRTGDLGRRCHAVSALPAA